MARDHSANTDNYMSLGAGALSPLLDGAGVVCVHALIYADAFAGASPANKILNVSIATTLAGIELAFTSNSLLMSGRSTSGDSQRSQNMVGTVATGQWVAVGARWDFAGDADNSLFVDGVNEKTGAMSWAATSYTDAGTQTKVDRIGSDAGGNVAHWFDGRIAELVGFVGDIGAEGFLALANRVPPHEVAKPAFYFSQLGTELRCPWSDVTAVITGSVPAADHPHRVQAGIWLPQSWGNALAISTAPILWLDAAQGVEEANGDPCEDSDPVLNWLDQSATGKDFVQSTESSRPLYIAEAVNGYPAIRFDGTNDYLPESDSTLLGDLTAFTGFFVFKLTDTSLEYPFLYAEETYYNWFNILIQTGNGLLATIGENGGSVVLAAPSEWCTSFVVVTLTFSYGGTARLFVDGVLQDSAAIGVNTTSSAGTTRSVGGFSPTAYMNGDIAEIKLYQVEQSDARRASIEADLITKYGIT